MFLSEEIVFTICVIDFGSSSNIGEFSSPESAAKVLLREGWKKNDTDPLYDNWKQWTFSLGNFLAHIAEFDSPLPIERLRTISRKAKGKNKKTPR